MPQASNTSKLPLILWSVAALVVVGAVIAGFVVTGGPQLQRIKSMDRRRASDLSGLSNDIRTYLAQEEKLPDRLEALKNLNNVPKKLPLDPLTGAKYDYHKRDDSHFALCAVFQLDNRTSELDYTEDCSPCNEGNYRHPKGKYCYQYRVKETKNGGSRYFSIERE